ncbi:hypothetical protein LSH36_1035g00004 [Paralvinella palmiformis]|uniref:Uncharacterized protein n=1 Tax=Paralvinella palmiformis TaxID=53620 RepID=A0AAD9MSX2_9ANNE|nr:hypothetical protein LSH36_1035g00004 [Paralvinella palmiformis]
MKAIFRCSILIRQSILQSRRSNPWTFNGSLTDCEEQCVPVELVTMMRWTVQGAQAATTDTRAKELNNTCRILSHSIVQACKTKRQISLTQKSTTVEFRCVFESPYSVGLSLYMYHSFRSQKAITLLNNAGVGVKYDRVQKICNSIANSVCENMREYGVYVPSAQQPTACIRNSRQCPTNSYPFTPWAIEGSPKPQTSPKYASYKMGVYDKLYDASQVNDLAWMTASYCNRGNSATNINLPGFDYKAPDLSDSSTSQPDESAETTEEPEALVANQSIEKQHVHLWSAYYSLIHTADDQNALPVIDKTFSLPIINAAATEWPTLVTALDQLTKLNTVVSGANSTVVVTLDMDLYKSVVKLELDYAQNIQEFIARNDAINTSDPELWQSFTNAMLLKFCLTAQELTRLADESERLVATTNTTAPPRHHQIARQESSTAQLKSVLAPCNLFQTDTDNENSDCKGFMFKVKGDHP